MIGILILFGLTGSLSFSDINNGLEIAEGASESKQAGLLTLATLCIFCGAIGKSAQFPLHVWLPDAMEGPTPVSALIHAATMVAAGVYMLVKVSFLLYAAPLAAEVIAWIGCITALIAALIATQQDDIKKVLAYSTLSQLGYMVMAVGFVGMGEFDKLESGFQHLRSGQRSLLPPLHPRLLQGAAVPRLRRGDLRLPPPAEHLEDGRAEAEDADHHARPSPSAPPPCSASPSSPPASSARTAPRGDLQQTPRLHPSAVHGIPHRVLHDPPVRRRLPRQGEIG